MDINIPILAANGHGYRNPIDSSEQLPSCAFYVKLQMPLEELLQKITNTMETITANISLEEPLVVNTSSIRKKNVSLTNIFQKF